MQALELLQEFSFARHALVTAVAIGAVCSLLSVVVVLKRMAFIGQGISHAGFGGIGTAIFLGLAGVAQDALVLLFCVGTALIVGSLSRRKRIEPDSAIGILLVAAMAWGVLMDDLSQLLLQYDWYAQNLALTGRRPSFESLLFGSITAVGWWDMWLAVAMAAGVLIACGALFKEIVFYTFDEPVSQVFGVPTRAVRTLLLVVLAVTIVISIRLVGVVLVSALLVLPGATALQLTRKLAPVLWLSLAVGLLGTVGGLLVSLQVGQLSTGPCIVGLLCALFAAGYAVGVLRGRRPTAG